MFYCCAFNCEKASLCKKYVLNAPLTETPTIVDYHDKYGSGYYDPDKLEWVITPYCGPRSDYAMYEQIPIESVPESGCEFCNSFDFSKARAVVDKYNTRIETAISNTGFDAEEQFKFCPVCGKKLVPVTNGKCHMYIEQKVPKVFYDSRSGKNFTVTRTEGRCSGTKEMDYVACKGNKKLCIYNKER